MNGERRPAGFRSGATGIESPTTTWRPAYLSLPQRSSSLLSPQSSSWSHLKARGTQEPEVTQRNWLPGSQVVVAEGRRRRRSNTGEQKPAFKRGRRLTALLLVAHVAAVVVAVAFPDAADAAAVGAAVLVGQTAVLWLEDNNCGEPQRCRTPGRHHNPAAVSPVLTQVPFCSW